MTVNPEELLAHADFVRFLARSLVADEHRAADIAQETWLAALEHPPATADSLKSWLSKVLRNFRRKLLRSEMRQLKRECAAAKPDRSPSTEEVVAREETRQRVVRAVLDLDEPYRSVILLRYYENLPPRAVAETLEAPLETIKTRLHRGLEQLRTRLDAAHGNDRKSWCAALAPLAGLNLKAAIGGGTSGSAAAGAGALAGALGLTARIKIGATAALLLGATITFWILVVQGDDRSDLILPDPNAGAIARSLRVDDVAAGDVSDAANGAGILARQPLLPAAQVSGRLLDAKCRRPVADAAVLLSMKEGEKRVWKTVTDGSGRFAIGGIEDPGSAWLAIRAPGYANRVLDVDGAGATVQAFDELLLEPRWCVEGRVVDRGGRPLAGARVTGLFKSRFDKVDGRWELIEEKLLAESGPDGSFLFCAGDDRSERYDSKLRFYRAEAEGFASPWTVRGDKEIVLLTVEPARSVKGKVAWSQDGSPVAGAWVRCSDPQDSNLEQLNATHVGDDGTFCFAAVPDRELDVGVFVQSPTSLRNPPECRVVAPKGLSDVGTLVVNGPASLEVWIRGEEKGEPIEGVRIGYGDSGYTMGSATTDSGGRATIDGLPAEKTIFISCALPSESKTQSYMRGKRTPTRIVNTGKPGTTTAAHLSVTTARFWEDEAEAPPEIPVAGSVTDPDGNPIAGARVELFIDGSPEPPDPDPIMRNRKLFFSHDFKAGFHPNYTADRSGRFRFGIPFISGIHVIRNVTVTHPHFVPIWRSGDRLDTKALENLSFTLEPVTEWLSGEVLAESGERIARCNVEAVYTVAEKGNEKVEFAFRSATDDVGRFHMPYVPDMILTCEASPVGYAGGSFRGESTGLRRTARPAIGIVVKKKTPPPDDPPPPRYPISVRCLSTEGRPVSDVEVTAWALEGESFSRGIGTYRGWFKAITGPAGRGAMETDMGGSVRVRSVLIKKSLLTARPVYLFEQCAFMEPGPGEKTITLPAGQVVELLIVYQGISDAVAECIDLLPTRSAVELVSENGGPALDLVAEELEENGKLWSTNHEELRYGGHRALAVRRLVPEGAYRLGVKIPGYIPHRSTVLTLLDSDEFLSLVVEIELQN